MSDAITEVERWGTIPGFDGMYEVSTLGRVRSWKFRPPGDPLIMRQMDNPNGYKYVKLSHHSAANHRTIHKLVALVHIGPRPRGWDICHNNGDRQDNRVSNLRYDTRAGNFADKIEHGTLLVGEAHPNSVLTVDLVRQIRSMQTSAPAIAAELELNVWTVRSVLDRRTWAWVP